MQEIIVTAIFGLVGFLGVKLINVLTNIQKTLEEININLASLTTKTDNHEKRLDKLEEKVNG